MTQAPAPSPTPRPRRLISLTLAVVAVTLISVNLRPGASAIGPVLEEIDTSLGLGTAAAGLLTALPGLCFGVLGALAVGFSRKVGMTGGITIGLVAVVAGLLLRSLTGSVPLFLLLSTLALGGMALGNVLVPAWIKRHEGSGVLLMTIYGTGLTVGGTVGPLLTPPLIDVAPGGWRGAIGVWGLTAALAVVPWVVITVKEHRDRADHRPAGAKPTARMRHSPTALALTLTFGIQSMNAYVQFGWLPQIYRDAGISRGHAGMLLSLLAGLGIIGGLVMPTVIARSRTLAGWMVSFGALMVVGYLGLLVAPATLPWLWAILLGIASFAFPTAITLITARSRDPRVTAQLSGFVQPIGYSLAALGPFVVGLVHAATGSWTVVLILLACSGVALALAGLRVSQPTMVDDELAARAAS